MDHPSSELLNFQSSICQSLPQENIDPKVCMNISVLPYPGSSAKYEDCMKAEVENITVENVLNDDYPKATSPSLQFPLFLTNTDNQIASKAKDSLEDRKKKGLDVVIIIRSQAPCTGAIQGNFVSIVGFSILLNHYVYWMLEYQIFE
jgi:hypothetical protein